MPLDAERLRSRHPFEIFFLSIATVTSLLAAITRQARPGSLQEGVGAAGSLGWAIVLFLGSAGALVGIFWRERATGLVLEALGLFVSGLCTIFFGIAAVVIVGPAAIYPGLTVIGYGVAACWRARDIRNVLVKVQTRYQEG